MFFQLCSSILLLTYFLFFLVLCFFIFFIFLHPILFYFFFFFNDTATPEISPLPLHDALPISLPLGLRLDLPEVRDARREPDGVGQRRHGIRRFDRPQDGPLAVVQPQAVSLGPRHLGPDRSEEHTSELQSQSNLVCRLLLEKKK